MLRLSGVHYMGVSENEGYLMMGSLYSGSYYLGSPVFGSPYIAPRPPPERTQSSLTIHLKVHKVKPNQSCLDPMDFSGLSLSLSHVFRIKYVLEGYYSKPHKVGNLVKAK